MKSAKPTASEASSSRRAQPLRQARTNPPRTQVNPARPSGGRDEPVGGQPIDIFPAITFFADTITALPKELVRHFTLLREVDAKLCAPEQQLFDLVSAAMDTTTAEAQLKHSITNTDAIEPTTNDVPNDPNGTADTQSIVTTTSNANTETRDQLILRRRNLFRQISFKIQEMLVSLEEKNHVISTANDALEKQLARVEDVWPHLENEFSDEAKWGSNTHWAYPENRTGKPTHPERARRDGAASITAAAQALADEAAARSDARKQALQAKKSLKNSHQDSDFDDHEPRNKKEGKKAGKVRQPADSNNVGLGIMPANGNPPPKKRKAADAAGGTTPSDRDMSALGLDGSKPAGVGSAARGPGPEPKKRRALPSGPGQAKKRPAKSPSAASSPVITSLPEPKVAARGSPAPSAVSRPATSRARGNSIHSVNENGKSRPPSVTSKVNGTPTIPQDTGIVTSAPRAGSDARSIKESSIPAKSELKKETDRPELPAPIINHKETKSQAHERRKSESQPPGPTPTTVTTKSGRASKPSTPALATFQEAARSRSARNTDNGGKKGHKKTASNAAALAPPPIDDDGMTSGDGDPDADELRYCYCNGVSYGEMVGCDHDECSREWFHLACVGLRVAPEGQWFCEDCKARMKGPGKKGNGR